MKFFRLALLGACSTTSLLAGTATAQTLAPAAGAPMVDEIIVTAQKRSENVQKVPVAVTVVSAKTLETSGATGLFQIAKVSPSLTLTPEANPVNAAIIMRGVGTFAFSIAAEPDVATVIDDVPAALQAQAFTDLVDLDRVEILRGPQSTLFGKSASAGVINIVTKAPSKDFTAHVEAMVTNDNEKRVAASVSGPITDTLAFRVTTSNGGWDGNINNLTSGKKVDGSRDGNYRAKIDWSPTDRFHAEFIAGYSHINSDCCAGRFVHQDRPANLFGLTAFPSSTVFAGITLNNDNLNARYDSPIYANSDLLTESARFTYDLPGGATIMSITGHSHYKLRDGADNDFTDSNVIPAYTNGATQGKYIQYGFLDNTGWSQELRLTSSNEGRLRYVGGLFYQDSDSERRLARGPAISVVSYDARASATNYAVFGQATLDLFEGTRLIGGARFNQEDISYSFAKYTTGQNFGRSDTDQVLTGRMGVQHDFTPAVMGFFTYNRGYKGQAYDLTSGLNPAVAAVQPVKAETSDSYETGLRSQFFQHRLTVNATAYYTTYSNFQAQEQQPQLGGAFILSNAGQVRTQGVELETAATPMRNLHLTASLAYTHARVVEFERAQCYTGQTSAQGCVGGFQNLAGATLPDAPDWKFVGGADYTLPTIAALPVDVILGGYYTWQSKVQYQLTQDPETTQKAYGVANLTATFQDKATGRYKLTAFVNNVFDQHYNARMDNLGSNFGGVNTIRALTPRDFDRYYGVRVSADF